ncbi:MAG: hypothetical protein IT270_10465 [Saprospiraceae bacterium]|nr:hypothetical protein [Saprospiraceae bacterium]
MSQISDSFNKITDASQRMMRRAVDDNMQFAGEMQDFFAALGVPVKAMNLLRPASSSQSGHAPGCACGCCPPACDCPPHCMLTLHRTAFPGERVILPFTVRNTTGSAKTYKVGVRELKDQHGNLAPSQPQLSQQVVMLEPNQKVTMMLVVEAGNFGVGQYDTEIVLREQDINQNICVQLHIVQFPTVPEALPKDEKYYQHHFQSWQSHFYCTPKKNTPGTVGNIVVTNNPR